jgi:hypothetical protein
MAPTMAATTRPVACTVSATAPMTAPTMTPAKPTASATVPMTAPITMSVTTAAAPDPWHARTGACTAPVQLLPPRLAC